MKRSKTKPDFVSIYLGTNDLATGDGERERNRFTANKLTSRYINFIDRIFEYYPADKLALLTSPMILAENNKILLDCLKKVKTHFEGIHTVAVFECTPMQPNGCDAHPDLKDHMTMADQLFPFYNDLLKK